MINKKVMTTMVVTAATLGSSVLGAKADDAVTPTSINTKATSQTTKQEATTISEGQKQANQAKTDQTKAGEKVSDAQKDRLIRKSHRIRLKVNKKKHRKMLIKNRKVLIKPSKIRIKQRLKTS
ncbi:hypothetical protein [Lactiplantibacillus plantarum]|uniref:hypothetical protein n=1 Tax=Lactiplantibacillus plantarum TaxID=1590 RepID=UPI003965D5BB